MKHYHAIILTLILSLTPCNANQHQIVIGHVTMPTYYNKTSPVRYIPKPLVEWDLTRETLTQHYEDEFFVGKGNMRQNINLISLYKLKIAFNQESGFINIISKNAEKNGKFTVKEVISMTVKSIRYDYPDKEAQVITLDGEITK